MAEIPKFNVTSGGIAHRYSRASADAINQYNSAVLLAKYQNDLNVDNWNMENEYNSPKAQMERYMEAGLNPNLIYSQDNTSGSVGNASVGSGIPFKSSEQYQSTINSALGALQSYQSGVLQEQQIEQMKVNNLKTMAETANISTLTPYQRDVLGMQIKKSMSDVIKNQSDTEQGWKSLDIQDKKIAMDYSNAKSALDEQRRHNVITEEQYNKKLSLEQKDLDNRIKDSLVNRLVATSKMKSDDAKSLVELEYNKMTLQEKKVIHDFYEGGLINNFNQGTLGQVLRESLPEIAANLLKFAK